MAVDETKAAVTGGWDTTKKIVGAATKLTMFFGAAVLVIKGGGLAVAADPGAGFFEGMWTGTTASFTDATTHFKGAGTALSNTFASAAGGLAGVTGAPLPSCGLS